MCDLEAHLRWNVEEVQRYLACFDTGAEPEVNIHPTGKVLGIRNLPLPDHFSPDYTDILLPLGDFPKASPRGFYVRPQEENKALLLSRIGILCSEFYATRLELQGETGLSTWLYVDMPILDWKYDPEWPGRGDNLAKYLMSFLRMLA